ncbi:unnamed protein product [Fusarium venenatum]|uniref:Uncharacterized protein n=1 Tax=Fusarium venenatum TaxID=56646 RepID=A0A2L2SRY7_9HYPO|nr:uncharacterized protein FVRRES_12502 [Fusarium venenatum]CEI39811.1 unnamed protein product [Fusarium venenatum]
MNQQRSRTSNETLELYERFYTKHRVELLSTGMMDCLLSQDILSLLVSSILSPIVQLAKSSQPGNNLMSIMVNPDFAYRLGKDLALSQPLNLTVMRRYIYFHQL